MTPGSPVFDTSPVTYRTVLRNGEFRALIGAEVLSLFGDQLARVALSILVLDRTHSALLSALTYAATFLPWLVAGPLLGVFADTRDRRDIMVLCDLVRALLVFAMTLPGVPLAVLFVLLFLTSLLAPPFEAARSAMVPDILHGEEYIVGQALASIVYQAGQVIGLAAAGLLVRLLTERGSLALDAASFLGSAIVVGLLVKSRPAHLTADEADQTGSWQRISEGWRVVSGSPVLRRLLGLAWLAAAVTVVPEALAVAYTGTLHRGPSTAGLLTAALPVGVVLGAWIIGSLVRPAKRIAYLRPMALLAVGGVSLSVLNPGVEVTWTIWVAAGVGAAFQIPANAAFVAAVPDAVRGRAFAVAQSGLQVFQGLAIVITGALAQEIGVGHVIGAAGIFGILGVGLLCFRWPPALTHKTGLASEQELALLNPVLVGAR